jgi:predicted ATP-grasp superfamily ATP-dependent carboligase
MICAKQRVRKYFSVTAMLPTAFVLNMFGTGLGIARNLGKHGIPVVGISSRTDAPGNYSRYCRSLIGPDSQNEPEKLLEFLIGVGKCQNVKGILFPTRDADVIFVDRYRKDLVPFYLVPQPKHDVLDLIMNKARLAQAAESIGIGTPWTIQISSMDELIEKRDEIRFPAVVKPVYAHQWRIPHVWEAVGKRKGIKVKEFGELFEFYRRISQYCSQALIQEWIYGPEDQFFVMGGYFNRNSECLGAFTAQKVVQFPPDFGLGCLVKAVQNEEVLSLGTRFLKSIHFAGIAEVEFKKDVRTGQYRLIEINPRHWDQHTLGTACGVNLTYLAYLDLLKIGELPHVVQARKDLLWINESGLLGILKENLKYMKIDLFKIMLCTLTTRKLYSVWDWQDRSPFWKMMMR